VCYGSLIHRIRERDELRVAASVLLSHFAAPVLLIPCRRVRVAACVLLLSCCCLLRVAVPVSPRVVACVLLPARCCLRVRRTVLPSLSRTEASGMLSALVRGAWGSRYLQSMTTIRTKLPNIHASNSRKSADLQPMALVCDGDPEIPLSCRPRDCVVISNADLWAAAREVLVNGCVKVFAAGSPALDVMCYVYTGGTTKHSKCVVVTHNMAL
jgi:hypothetical protein